MSLVRGETSFPVLFASPERSHRFVAFPASLASRPAGLSFRVRARVATRNGSARNHFALSAIEIVRRAHICINGYEYVPLHIYTHLRRKKQSVIRRRVIRAANACACSRKRGWWRKRWKRRRRRRSSANVRSIFCSTRVRRDFTRSIASDLRGNLGSERLRRRTKTETVNYGTWGFSQKFRDVIKRNARARATRTLATNHEGSS